MGERLTLYEMSYPDLNEKKQVDDQNSRGGYPDYAEGRRVGNIKDSDKSSIPELRSCVKVEVDVLGSPSHIVLTVSVDVKQQWIGLLLFLSLFFSSFFFFFFFSFLLLLVSCLYSSIKKVTGILCIGLEL